MNTQTQVLISGLSGVGVAVALGTISKVIIKKKPELKPVVEVGMVFTSGLLIGAGVGILVASKFVTKSVAASILASD